MIELISINEAAARGIERVRLPAWANPLDHLKIDIFDGRPGPWVHLFAVDNSWINERDPVDILCFASEEKINVLQVDPREKGWEPYTGPTADSEEYKAESAARKKHAQEAGL